MDDSPLKPRRFSRWQTRKRTFILGGTAITAPASNTKSFNPDTSIHEANQSTAYGKSSNLSVIRSQLEDILCTGSRVPSISRMKSNGQVTMATTLTPEVEDQHLVKSPPTSPKKSINVLLDSFQITTQNEPSSPKTSPRKNAKRLPVILSNSPIRSSPRKRVAVTKTLLSSVERTQPTIAVTCQSKGTSSSSSQSNNNISNSMKSLIQNVSVDDIRREVINAYTDSNPNDQSSDVACDELKENESRNATAWTHSSSKVELNNSQILNGNCEVAIVTSLSCVPLHIEPSVVTSNVESSMVTSCVQSSVDTPRVELSVSTTLVEPQSTNMNPQSTNRNPQSTHMNPQSTNMNVYLDGVVRKSPRKVRDFNSDSEMLGSSDRADDVKKIVCVGVTDQIHSNVEPKIVVRKNIANSHVIEIVSDGRSCDDSNKGLDSVNNQKGNELGTKCIDEDIGNKRNGLSDLEQDGKSSKVIDKDQRKDRDESIKQTGKSSKVIDKDQRKDRDESIKQTDKSSKVIDKDQRKHRDESIKQTDKSSKVIKLQQKDNECEVEKSKDHLLNETKTKSVKSGNGNDISRSMNRHSRKYKLSLKDRSRLKTNDSLLPFASSTCMADKDQRKCRDESIKQTDKSSKVIKHQQKRSEGVKSIEQGDKSSKAIDKEQKKSLTEKSGNVSLEDIENKPKTPTVLSDSSQNRSLRNRRCLKQPVGGQYPMEFFSQRTLDNLSSKAKAILIADKNNRTNDLSQSKDNECQVEKSKEQLLNKTKTESVKSGNGNDTSRSMNRHSRKYRLSLKDRSRLKADDSWLPLASSTYMADNEDHEIRKKRQKNNKEKLRYLSMIDNTNTNDLVDVTSDSLYQLEGGLTQKTIQGSRSQLESLGKDLKAQELSKSVDDGTEMENRLERKRKEYSFNSSTNENDQLNKKENKLSGSQRSVCQTKSVGSRSRRALFKNTSDTVSKDVVSTTGDSLNQNKVTEEMRRKRVDSKYDASMPDNVARGQVDMSEMFKSKTLEIEQLSKNDGRFVNDDGNPNSRHGTESNNNLLSENSGEENFDQSLISSQNNVLDLGNRSLRDRSSLRKPSLNYPVEFLSSSQQKCLSREAKKSLLTQGVQSESRKLMLKSSQVETKVCDNAKQQDVKSRNNQRVRNESQNMRNDVDNQQTGESQVATKHLKPSTPKKTRNKNKRVFSLPKKRHKKVNTANRRFDTTEVFDLSQQIVQSMMVVNDTLMTFDDPVSRESIVKEVPSKSRLDAETLRVESSQPLDNTIPGVCKVRRKRNLFSQTDPPVVKPKKSRIEPCGQPGVKELEGDCRVKGSVTGDDQLDGQQTNGLSKPAKKTSNRSIALVTWMLSYQQLMEQLTSE